jgi:hypothetical protein
MNNETYYRLCGLKLFRMWVLDLEPTKIILENESESAIIYARPGVITPSVGFITFRMGTHQNVARLEPDDLPSIAMS